MLYIRLIAPFTLAACLLGASLLLPANARAETEWDLGGDFRLFGFLALEDLPGQRQDSELLALRLKAAAQLSENLSFEVHGLLGARSPALARTAALASGSTRRYLGLEHTLNDSTDLFASAELDRLSVQWDTPDYRLTVGRQAITWGVNYFWPAMDLFAPFAPERIDRDYKPGVDALRLTVPTGDFSEWDFVIAGQGDRFSDDFSFAALRRWNIHNSDVALMAASSHTDWVVGGFLVTDLWGVGIRTEVTYTDSGDEQDAAIGRASFWRASVGLDKQVSETVNVVVEAAWNGFGANHAGGYAEVFAADRFQRGEVNALGHPYLGISMGWQAHPLLTLSAAMLGNLDDGSVLLQPNGSWSLADNADAQFGLILGFGSGVSDSGQIGSEYGGSATTVWAAIKTYF